MASSSSKMSAEILNLRDPDEAKAWLVESRRLTRAMPHTKGCHDELSQIIFLMVAEGSHVAPLHILGDLYYLIVSLEHVQIPLTPDPPWPVEASTLRQYEDYVLGKMLSDSSFRRGADAVLSYMGNDRQKAIAYMLNRITSRMKLGGAIINPTILKQLEEDETGELADSLDSEIISEMQETIVRQTEQAIQSVLKAGATLGQADLIELEKRTAITAFAQRLALRQIVEHSEYIEQRLPQLRLRKVIRESEVATNIEDEDTYPVGGFNSVSNRGSVESLLHSQLAYMEPDNSTRPDLFDIRFLRDELLYYARDENQFWRRRAEFLVVLTPELKKLRVKRPEQAFQDIIILVAMLRVLVQELVERLSEDALSIEFLLLQEKRSTLVLNDELPILELLFQDEIAAETVSVRSAEIDEVLDNISRSRHAGHQSLVLSTSDQPLEIPNVDDLFFHQLQFTGSGPQLRCGFAYDRASKLPQEWMDHESTEGLTETATLLFHWVFAHYGG